MHRSEEVHHSPLLDRASIATAIAAAVAAATATLSTAPESCGAASVATSTVDLALLLFGLLFLLTC